MSTSNNLNSIDEIAEIVTGKSNVVDATTDGLYPLFDRSQLVKRSKRFLYDAEAVIVPGEGKEFIPRYYKGKFDLHQRAYALIPNENVDGRFLYYSILHNKDHFSRVAVGSTVKSLRLASFKSLSIHIPSLEQQKQIARILTVFDEKIELNRKTNQTLEEIAQAIFKEWFIDFNYPGATGEMVESELGPIPKGWSVDNLGGFATVSSGKGLKRTEFTDEGYPVLGANGQIGFTNHYLLDDEVILTGRVGTLGTLQLINKKVWISDNVLIITPKEDFYYHYLYLWLKTVDFTNLNRGSTQPLITKTDLLNLQTLRPDINVLIYYDRLCRRMFDLIARNTNENEILSDIRDLLLQKLMSGEIEI